jgi:hypothetical protein
MNRVFSKEVQIANKCTKKCSPTLAIKEMQIKMALRVYFIPVRMAVIKKINNTECWRGWRGKNNLYILLWEYKLVQPLLKSLCTFLKKLKVEVLYYLIYYSWAYIQRNVSQNTIAVQYLYTHIYNNTIYNSQAMESV